MDQQKEAAACAACNHMRRKCPPNCIFAPYFPTTSPSFDYVYHVYGCSNVGKILQSLPIEQRMMAAESLAFEAEARIRDPVLGCVGYIYLLQQHLAQIDRDIQEAETQIYAAGYQPPPLPPPLEQHWYQMPQLTTMTTVPSHYEQPNDLLCPAVVACQSMPQVEPTPPMHHNQPLMTDTEVQDFAAQLEESLLCEIPSTPPPMHYDQQLMTHTEVQDYAQLEETLLCEIPSTPPQQDETELLDFTAMLADLCHKNC